MHGHGAATARVADYLSDITSTAERLDVGQDQTNSFLERIAEALERIDARQAENEANDTTPFLLIATLTRWRIRDWLPYTPPQPDWHYVGTETFTVRINEGKAKAMNLVLKDDEKGVLQLQVTTKAGNPADIDGAIRYEYVNADDDRKVILAPSPDTRSVTLQTLARVEGDAPTTGLVQFTATADADLGEGVVEFSQTFNLTIEPSVAGGFIGTFGNIEKVR